MHDEWTTAQATFDSLALHLRQGTHQPLTNRARLLHNTAAVTSAVKKQALGSVICFLLFLGPCILYLWKVNLSGVSVIGGLLPQLTFQNGQVMLYGVYWIGMLAAVGGSFLAIRKKYLSK